MSTRGLEQQARELLAAEYVAEGLAETSWQIASCGETNGLCDDPDIAVKLGLRAIEKALTQAREAAARIEALETALRDMLRLADMGLEESLREPEENGNYAAYNRAKSLLSNTGGGGD